MALTNYCEFDEVRAALGANELELKDAVLSLPVYEIGLVRELGKVSASLPVAFSTANNVPEESRTEAQKAMVDATRIFSVYAAAKQVGVSLGSFVPKDVGDGKATMSRFSDSPYKDVLARIDAMYATTRESLVQAYAEFSGASTSTSNRVPFKVFSRAGRSYDPVTGV